jgi:glucose/arabinose dehydrogenase
MRWRRWGAGAVVLGLALAGCGSPEPERTPTVTTPTSDASPDPAPTDDADDDAGGVAPSGPRGPALPDATDAPQDVLSGLTTPWDVAFLDSGAVLVTLRDPGQVLILTAEGVETLTGPGAEELAAGTDEAGEGGLLGVTLHPDDDTLVYLYRTTPSGNEVLRGTLDAGAATLAELEPVLTGIPASRTHNGGRIAFGPDGYLYVATGDAAGNLVASEFGQNRVDELNVVEPGGHHGWPEVEGVGGEPGYVDPVVTWTPAEASPSGIAVTDDAVYVAALRGQRLWRVPWADGAPAGEPTAHLVGDLGRLRHVEVGPDGALWVLTQNTDGRGRPQEGDDRLVRLLPP